MRKYLWLVALIAASLSAATVAADGSPTQQDLAFVQELAQQAKAPESPVLADDCPAPLAANVYCQGVYCNIDQDCWAYCIGGVGASYCNRGLHNCVPY
jgi:hypothetical protein